MQILHVLVGFGVKGREHRFFGYCQN